MWERLADFFFATRKGMFITTLAWAGASLYLIGRLFELPIVQLAAISILVIWVLGFAWFIWSKYSQLNALKAVAGFAHEMEGSITVAEQAIEIATVLTAIVTRNPEGQTVFDDFNPSTPEQAQALAKFRAIVDRHKETILSSPFTDKLNNAKQLIQDVQEKAQRGGAPRGPRLTDDVTREQWLHYMIEAKRARALADNRGWAEWVRTHRGPFKDELPERTVDTWLQRYATEIAEYERQQSAQN